MMFEKNYKNSFQLSADSYQTVKNENYSQHESSAKTSHLSVNKSNEFNKMSMPIIAQSLDEANGLLDPLWSDFLNFLEPLSIADESNAYLANFEGNI